MMKVLYFILISAAVSCSSNKQIKSAPVNDQPIQKVNAKHKV